MSRKNLKGRLLKSGVSLLIGLLALSIVNGQIYADVVTTTNDTNILKLLYYLLIVFCIGSGILFLSAISTAIMAVAINTNAAGNKK